MTTVLSGPLRLLSSSTVGSLKFSASQVLKMSGTPLPVFDLRITDQKAVGESEEQCKPERFSWHRKAD